jgi:two-component system, cell cycle response regulator
MADGENRRVLVLDDESKVVELLTQHLSNEGYDCSGTTSPREALDIISHESVALLVSDVKMPEMDGIQVLREARAIDPDLAFVIVTAYMDVSDAILAIRAGANDYVLKPFNFGEISVAASKALEKRRLLIENRAYQEALENRVRAATEDLEHVNVELRRTSAYLENLLNSTADAIVTVYNDGTIGYVNQGAVSMLGYDLEDLTGRPVADVFVRGRAVAEDIASRLRESSVVKNFEAVLQNEKGDHIPVMMTLSRVRAEGDEPEATLAICKDITEQKELQEQLKEMSIRDSLTDLYNQRYFNERLRSEIERAKRQNHPLSMLLFDIDQFKKYNDRHGHLAGDTVLQSVGRVVRECTRDHVDIGFRYGGDEFCVLLPEAGEQQAFHVAERIRDSFEAQGFDGLTVSIGLMSYKEGTSMRSFIQFADDMMYDAKRSGGNRVFVYEPPKGEAVGR